MSVHLKPPPYCVYVLRFWEERDQHPDRPGVWRFSLEDTRTGQRRGFGDLEALVAFLRAELEGPQLELSRPELQHPEGHEAVVRLLDQDGAGGDAAIPQRGTRNAEC